MKVEMTKKNNVSRISDIKYGDTFIFSNNVFMKANVNEMDFECPECEAVVEAYNYGFFAVNIENGEIRKFDNDFFELCTCNVKVEKGGVENED